jgi:hypothetical protein
MQILQATILTSVLMASASAQSLGAKYYCPAADNSTGSPAVISATGSDVVGGNALNLLASGMPNNQFGFFLVGPATGLVANPGGSQGTICIGGGLGRFNGQVMNSGSSGTISAVVDTLAVPVNPLTAIAGGETWHFQAWYRDLNPGTASNFTDAIAIGFRDVGITADCSANLTSGSAPLTVQFSQAAVGASAFAWDFGDGGNSTAGNPSHTFSAPGTYLVELVTTGSAGSAADLLVIEVTSGPPTFAPVWAAFNVVDPAVGLSCLGCHGAGGFGNLNMSTEAGAYAALVGTAANCGNGNTRVIAGDANGSLLYQKLANTQTCGQSMPFGSPYAGDLALIYDWIEAGAQQ